MSSDAAPRLAYRVNEAAALIGVSPSTLWRRINDKTVYAPKVHGVVLVPHEELERLVRPPDLATEDAGRDAPNAKPDRPL